MALAPTVSYSRSATSRPAPCRWSRSSRSASWARVRPVRSAQPDLQPGWLSALRRQPAPTTSASSTSRARWSSTRSRSVGRPRRRGRGHRQRVPGNHQCHADARRPAPRLCRAWRVARARRDRPAHPRAEEERGARRAALAGVRHGRWPLHAGAQQRRPTLSVISTSTPRWWRPCRPPRTSPRSTRAGSRPRRSRSAGLKKAVVYDLESMTRGLRPAGHAGDRRDHAGWHQALRRAERHRPGGGDRRPHRADPPSTASATSRGVR